MIKRNKCPRIKIRIGESKECFLLDTGAKISLMDYNKWFTKERFTARRIIAKQLDGNTVKILRFYTIKLVEVKKEITIWITTLKIEPILGWNEIKNIGPDYNWGTLFEDIRENNKRTKEIIRKFLIRYRSNIEENKEIGNIRTIEVDSVEIKQQAIKNMVELDIVEDNFKEVFKEELGTLKDFEVDIRLEKNYRPKFCGIRRLQLSWIEEIDKELDKWLKEGIIKSIVHIVWATPLVPIGKQDNRLKLCIDYRVSVSEKTSKILTITTHRGLFAFCRLPFGLKASAPIFKSPMAALFQGIGGVMYYLDDVLICGRTEEEHNTRLVKVLDIILENAVDASNEGIGGALLQMTDNVEKPILFLSRRFSSTEKNYSTIEKKALAVKFGLAKCK
ncbi:uncharacterized protein LOC135924457 [Gordionus sp. m RMFG-2023]|uniref:uncharacterized protein LOC135924457 n=1 Tax=Gordionus sp. m RMFG-2023 TaxID=3053472 RepID=UPI0031FDEAF4